MFPEKPPVLLFEALSSCGGGSAGYECSSPPQCHLSFAPTGAKSYFSAPTAHAVGYNISPRWGYFLFFCGDLKEERLSGVRASVHRDAGSTVVRLRRFAHRPGEITRFPFTFLL